MPMKEMIAEIRAAAASLITAAGAAENGDIAAAEIGIEDALFRSESLLSRIRQGEFTVTVEPPPAGVAQRQKAGQLKIHRPTEPGARPVVEHQDAALPVRRLFPASPRLPGEH